MNLYGINSQLRQLETAVISKRPALLVGPQGVGKTSSAYYIAEKLGFEVFEINASDERKKEKFEQILRMVRIKVRIPTLFLLDEIDGISREMNWRILYRIIKYAYGRNPLVMTANEEWKVPKFIRESKYVVVIKYYRPSKRHVLEFAKKELVAKGVKIKDFSKIVADFRASQIALKHNLTAFDSTDVFEDIKRIFLGRFNDWYRFVPEYYVWLIDNLQFFYHDERKIFDAINLIALAQQLRKPSLLKNLPKPDITLAHFMNPSVPTFLILLSKRKKV